MDYYESAEDIVITRERARREVLDHGGDEESWAQFLAEVGARENYDAQEVLAWLGY